MNIFLSIHIVLAVILIVVILLQKVSSDGISNSFNNFSTPNSSSFLTKTTIVLAIMFFINAIVLANLSNSQRNSVIEKLQKFEDLPIAK